MTRGGAEVIDPVRFPSPVVGSSREGSLEQGLRSRTVPHAGEDRRTGSIIAARRAGGIDWPWGCERRFFVGASLIGKEDCLSRRVDGLRSRFYFTFGQ